jgi:hypothetical protein
VNNGTHWDVLQWQVVTWLDVGRWTLLDLVTLLQLGWSDDVTLGSINVVKKSDASGTVWVVLDVRTSCVYAILVAALEVDYAVLTLVSSTDVAGGHASSTVTSTGLV